MSNDPILVTGSAGFIGYHLASELLNQGREVVGFDNFNDYYDPALKEARNAQLEKSPNFTCVRGDLADFERVSETFQTFSFSDVIHLAAQAGVRYSLTHPFAYVQANLTGFVNILEAVRHSNCSRLLYASSSSVYGGNTKLPFSESDRVDNPISLYAATKKANELIAHSYSHLYDMRTVGFRFFTVYGPWGRPDMAMWIFADKISKGIPIPVFNHGDMRRDFTFVDDIIQGLVNTLDATGLKKYEIFNLGNHQSEKLLDMIELIEQCLGKKAILDLQPIQPGDVPATFADVDHARELLGYAPTTPISVGVPKFIEWFKDYHSMR